jgi:NADP-dependent 3-hydroxy acid dehydrogenase YdfG
MPGVKASAPVLVITGASSGIGEATARAAAGAGWRLVLAARRRDRLQALIDELGGPAVAIAARCDVTDWAEVERLPGLTLDSFGRLDAVFANAGVTAKRGFLEGSVEQWRSMVLTNVLGVAHTVRATLPHLLRRGVGHFVLNASAAGRRTVPGSLYGATKAAVVAMGEALRAELHQLHKNRAIRVTLLEPGATRTEMVAGEQLPFRAMEAEDIAAAVLFALSRPDHVDVNELLVRATEQPAKASGSR